LSDVVFDLKDSYYAERDLLAIAKFLVCIVLWWSILTFILWSYATLCS